MKKIICMLIAVLMVIACTVTASATEYTGYREDVGSGQIDITSHVYSHFTISIPETIDTEIPNDGMVILDDVSLEEGYAIFVRVGGTNDNGKVVMTNKRNPNVTAELSINGNYSAMPTDIDKSIIMKFDEYEIVDGHAEAGIACQIDPYAPAGYYGGTVTYSISCEPKH